MFQKQQGEYVIYKSSDEICKASTHTLDQEQLYPLESLNSLNSYDMPPHAIKLKKDIRVKLLRNVNTSSGLCSETLIIITHLGKLIILSN